MTELVFVSSSNGILKKPLNLVLTHEWWNAIAEHRKNVEYRKLTPFWAKRLIKYAPGDYVLFRKGYSDIIIVRTILRIDYTNIKKEIPEEVIRFLNVKDGEMVAKIKFTWR